MGETAQRRPLFERFPALCDRIPLALLAELPTPVRALEALGGDAGTPALWLKDDGPSSPEYGGNKVRKLELLLAAARARGARTVLTFGYAGSNHATATAVHAARLGMNSVSMLLPQHNAAYLRRNLLVSSAVGAELHEHSSRGALVAGSLLAIVRRAMREGALPHVIAPGGSSPLGTVGFVNAAFELAAQVDAGRLPLPERIYAAAGSLGTVVGLGIGLAALGLPTKVVGVRVVDERYVSPKRALALWRSTVALLGAAAAEFPKIGDPEDRIELRGEFFGGSYALPTAAGEQARRAAGQLEALDLDVTYTAKTLACLLADARNRRLGSGPVLFWNTCNSSDLSRLEARATVQDLPRRLGRYFESPKA